jgi:multidrug transporter EmrE-like cation transporter
MTNKKLFFLLVILAAILEAGGDIVLKKWALDNKNLIFALGLALYLGAVILWAFSLKHEVLSKAISVVTIINLIIVVLVGVFYFHDDLSLVNKLGIVLGIISIALIEA